MSMRTYEELIAAQTELAHFNQNHDPRNGQFAKGHGGTNSSASFTKKEKKTVLKKMREDQKEHFRSQISDEEAKVTRLGRNGYDERGSDWNAAYRKGKVTSKDDREIKAAAKATRDYMNKTYGKELTKALSKSTIFTGTKTIDEYLDNYGGMKIKELLKK